MAELIRVPRPDYVECVRCLALIGRQHDGPALHAAASHPRARTDRLYRAAPDYFHPTPQTVEQEQP